MPVVNVEPNNTTGLTHNVWTGTKFSAVRLPDDDDTSFLRSDGSAGGLQDAKTTEWPTDAGAVNSIQVRGRVRRETAVGKSCFIGVENGSGNTTVNITFQIQGSYTTVFTGALARPGGGSWTPADLSVNVTWLHAFASPADGRGGRLTTWTLILDYIQSGDSFTNVWHKLLPIIGTQLTLMNFRLILAYARPKTRFNEKEIRQAWHQFLAYRRPRHFILQPAA